MSGMGGRHRKIVMSCSPNGARSVARTDTKSTPNVLYGSVVARFPASARTSISGAEDVNPSSRAGRPWND